MLLCVLSMLLVHLTKEVTCDYGGSQSPMYTATVNITYRDPHTGDMHSYEIEHARYGTESRMDSEWGWVVHVRTIDNTNDGCKEIVNVPKVRWIALIERGGCKFQEKIYNAAIEKNASAVVVYNDKDESDLISMQHKVQGVVAIFMDIQEGQRIAKLVDSGVAVRMHISVASLQAGGADSINKTSMLFVTVSSVVLIIVSLGISLPEFSV